MWEDVGTNGGNTDAAIFNQCLLCEYIVSNQLGIPVVEPIVAGDNALHYFFLCDKTFLLKRWLIKL